MSEVSNGDIYNLLVNMRGDLGRLEGKFDGHKTAFEAHVEDDKELNRSMQRLKSAQDRQRGFVTALSTVGGLIGAGLGVALDLILRK